MRIYEHRSTTPIYMKDDVKLFMGDVYEENDDGSWVVKRLGQVILSSEPTKPEKKEEPKVVEKEEKPVVKKKPKVKKGRGAVTGGIGSRKSLSKKKGRR